MYICIMHIYHYCIYYCTVHIFNFIIAAYIIAVYITLHQAVIACTADYIITVVDTAVGLKFAGGG